MRPFLAPTVEAVRAAVSVARNRNWTIGLVPTMGALHEGHASLIRAARREVGFVALSLFVNPTQFGPGEDYQRYPRAFERDMEVCEREGVNLVFAPPPETVYPEGYRTYVEVHGLQDVLCGASRPGHFRGVCTVVLKLFNMVGPDVAYFGRKDAQQALIVRKMVADLNVPVRVRVCPIVREPDGLALSSRNRYLDPERRKHAVALYQALEAARERIAAGERDAEAVRRGMAEHINAAPGAVLDYAEVVSAETLQRLERVGGKVLLALAVKFGGTRLIDNLLLEVTPGRVSEASL